MLLPASEGVVMRGGLMLLAQLTILGTSPTNMPLLASITIGAVAIIPLLAYESIKGLTSIAATEVTTVSLPGARAAKAFTKTFASRFLKGPRTTSCAF